jgi:hypothetical protein
MITRKQAKEAQKFLQALNVPRLEDMYSPEDIRDIKKRMRKLLRQLRKRFERLP